MAQTRVGVRRPGIWDGLLAYYRADGTPNDVINGNDLTLVNGTTYGDGIINQGFQFDGVNDYAQYNGDIGITGDFSISGWFNPNSGTISSFLSSYNYEVGSRNDSICIAPFSGTLRIYVVNSLGVNISQDHTSAYTLSNWSHFVITFNNTTKKIDVYVNGVLHPNSSTTTFTDYNTTGFVTGIITGKRGVRYLNGLIDELGIWNRQLTPTEVSQLYNSGNGKQK